MTLQTVNILCVTNELVITCLPFLIWPIFSSSPYFAVILLRQSDISPAQGQSELFIQLTTLKTFLLSCRIFNGCRMVKVSASSKNDWNEVKFDVMGSRKRSYF